MTDLERFEKLADDFWNDLQISKEVDKEKHKEFIKTFPIIALNIMKELKYYDKSAMSKYLRYIAAQKKIINGLEVWYANPEDYAQKQIDFIRFVFRARRVDINSPNVKNYLDDISKEIKKVYNEVNEEYSRKQVLEMLKNKLKERE